MRIAHFGTFDVDNYGDLLFPHLAEWRLPETTLVNVSPTGATPAFSDSRPSISVATAREEDFDYFIVGGGNIVNFRVSSLTRYESIPRQAYASLWLGAAQQASEARRPLAFNGPSISQAQPGNLERRLLVGAVSGAAYAAFRDEESIKNVAAASAVLIPDTAFDLGRMWPLEDGRPPPPSGSIAVHLNERYIQSIQGTAGVLDSLARRFEGPLRLVPIGPCHGDPETAHRVAAAMSTPASVEPVTTLRAMASAIADSELYIGSSMHGFITALAYGRRAVLVLNESPMHKFLGVIRAAGLSPAAIATSWAALLATDTLGVSLSREARSDIYAALDRHWHCVREGAGKPGKEAARIVDRWRQMVPLARLESVAARATGKLARYFRD